MHRSSYHCHKDTAVFASSIQIRIQLCEPDSRTFRVTSRAILLADKASLNQIRNVLTLQLFYLHEVRMRKEVLASEGGIVAIFARSSPETIGSIDD